MKTSAAAQIIIAPSILSADFAALGAAVGRVKRAGAKWLHIDVMDGHFVPNLTVGAPVVKSLRRASDMFFDVHLMVANPAALLDDFIAAGSDAVTFHVESAPSGEIVSLLRKTKKAGLAAGISIKPKTPARAIERFAPLADIVLVMSVEPGFGGQKFRKSAVSKIRQVRAALDRINPRCVVSVDGGINASTAREAVRAGAGVLVAGHSVFGASRPVAAAFKSLERAARR